MLLTEHNLFYYLLDKGMTDLSPVINGEFTVRRSDSRNNNFIVNKEYDHHSYFIKQVKAPDAEKIETMQVEATAYRLAHTDPQYKALKDFLPDFHYYDNQHHILVTGQVKEALSVYDYYMQVPAPDDQLPALIADILASFHKTIGTNGDQQAFRYFKRQLPWVFSVASQAPASLQAPAVSADQQLMQLIAKNQDLPGLIQPLSSLWQPVSLLHNDAKLNNFLVGYDQEKNKVRFIRLIDWELADIGDPLWDLATVMQHYLTLWLTTDVPEQETFFKKITLEQVQPRIQQLWNRYARQVNWPPAQRQAALLKTIRFCALKLIHTCFETTTQLSVLQPVTVKMLQVSINILKAPADAATKLFGINMQYEKVYQ